MSIQLIAKEREEQITKHGYTQTSDIRHNAHGELVMMAAALISNGRPPMEWDELVVRRMLRKPYKERLIIAAALLSAEIDRVNGIGL